MTTPAPPVLYASISDLKLVLDSTDAGTGTAAQLSDEQLTLALTAATDRVALYAGYAWQAVADVPGLIGDLTLDLAAWWATTYYLKQKDMGPNHPVVLRYTEAKNVLESLRKGEIDLALTPVPAGTDITADVGGGKVINRIPAIFDDQDSNTTVDAAGVLQADQPSELGPRRGLLTFPPDGMTTGYW